MQDIMRVNRLEEEARKSREAAVQASAPAQEPVYDDFEETNIEPELRKDIEAVLNVMVRPHLAQDGGDLEVAYLDEDGTLWIRMIGGCAGCPSADETAKGLVEKELACRIPRIKAVEIDDGLDYDFIENALNTMLTTRAKKN